MGQNVVRKTLIQDFLPRKGQDTIEQGYSIGMAMWIIFAMPIDAHQPKYGHFWQIFICGRDFHPHMRIIRMNRIFSQSHGNIEHPCSHTDSLVASFSLGTLRLLKMDSVERILKNINNKKPTKLKMLRIILNNVAHP